MTEDIMRCARQRELKLLQAATFEALLTALTEGPRASYVLAFCSLVLCDHQLICPAALDARSAFVTRSRRRPLIRQTATQFL